ncbi:hypothetical protein AB0N73_11160 [Microbacterium sp. NPDC089189]|uniref:hypothetical protein n=1 Tax=Microbacterium sp. NPDC089189 TaxID=3154972 RepID=UPI00341DE27E
MTAPGESAGPVRPAVALVLTLIGFLAVVIAGFGFVSLATDSDVVSVPSLGPLPGVIAVAGAGAAYAGVTARAVGARHPRYRSAAVVAAAAWAAYGLAGAVAAALGTGDLVTGAVLLGALWVGWPGLVVAAAAAVAAWSAVALVRTRAGRPQWPWEGDDDE